MYNIICNIYYVLQDIKDLNFTARDNLQNQQCMLDTAPFCF